MFKKRNSIEIFLDKNNEPSVKINMKNQNSLSEIQKFCGLFFGLLGANRTTRDVLAFGLDKYLIQENNKTLTDNVMYIINSLNLMNNQVLLATELKGNPSNVDDEEPIIDPES